MEVRLPLSTFTQEVRLQETVLSKIVTTLQCPQPIVCSIFLACSVGFKSDPDAEMATLSPRRDCHAQRVDGNCVLDMSPFMANVVDYSMLKVLFLEACISLLSLMTTLFSRSAFQAY